MRLAAYARRTLSSLLKNILHLGHSDPSAGGEESRSEKTSNARFLVGRRGGLLGMSRLGGGELLNELFGEVLARLVA